MLSVKLWREEWIMTNCKTCNRELEGEPHNKIQTFCSEICLDIAEEQNDGKVHNYRILPEYNRPQQLNSETALRYNKGKLAWGLVYWKALSFMVEVLMFGANKYAPNNWKKGMNKMKLLESMQRHINALFDGETHDEDSKLHHIGHVMCNCMFYAFYVLNPLTEIPYQIDGDSDRAALIETEYRHKTETVLIENVQK